MRGSQLLRYSTDEKSPHTTRGASKLKRARRRRDEMISVIGGRQADDDWLAPML